MKRRTHFPAIPAIPAQPHAGWKHGFITRLGDSGILWVTLTALLLVFRKTRRVGCVLAAALLVDAVLCNLILKPLVARIRPCDILADVQLLISRPDDFSFPSGHTAASFASVTALWLAGKKQWALAALPLGVLIAFSRMYLFVHYPTDIIGGVLVGVGCGWIGGEAGGNVLAEELCKE